MKQLFLYIKDRIETRIPELKVELFNNQFIKADTERSEKAIKYPICYVEFVTENVNNFPLKIKDYILRVRFRIGVEGYKFQRLETFDFVDEFYRAIHMMRPTDVSELMFTSFQEIMPEFDEDHNNVDRPYIDYRTRYRSRVAYDTPLIAQATQLDIGIEVERNVIFSEPQEQKPVYIYESSEKPVYFREM